MKRLGRTFGALLIGFLGGLVTAWIVIGPRADAAEGTVAFARNVEVVTDSVVTLELMERSGCEAVREHHIERLRSGVVGADGILDEIPRLRIDDLPSARSAFEKARSWSEEHGLDELGERSRELIDDMMQR